MEESDAESVLEDFGLSKKEVQVYLSLLRLGGSTVSRLAKETKINRITVYDVLKYLGSKGLVSSIDKNSKKYFSAADPKILINLLEEKKEKIKSILPQLEVQKKTVKEITKLEFYEGKSGMKVIMDDIIKTGVAVLSFGTRYKLSEFLKYYVPQFIKNRIKYGIK